MKTYYQASILPLLTLCTILGGCGGGKDKEAATQVAAKVNTTEITVFQVNNVLAKAPNVTPAGAPRIKREILNNLIDQQLARQQAVENKLDRSPEVMQTLEAAKTEILARAYLARIVAAQPKPMPAEIKSYYDQHPALFAQRRVYSIEEISLPTQPGLAASLLEETAKARSLQDVAAWLKSQNIQFTANSGVRAAEQLPFEYLEKIQAMKDGESQVFELRGGIQVIRVVASKPIPVNEVNATPKIQQFLFTQQSNEAIIKEMKLIRGRAKIEYVGEFSATAAEAEATAKAQLAEKLKTEKATKAKAEAETAAAVQAKAKATIEAQATTDAIAKAREDANQARREADAKSPPPMPKQLSVETIEKGARGL
jgi:EpsD family peptidyl-prolyl cis-trans isomerase